MLAPARRIRLDDQLSNIGARSLAADWRSDILFLSERLFIGQPLPVQRLSSAASERPRRIAEHYVMTISTAVSGPGRASGPGQRPKL